MGEPDATELNALLRKLPKVDEVLRGEAMSRLLETAPRWAVVDAVRAEIEALRARLLASAKQQGRGTANLPGSAVEPASATGHIDEEAVARRTLSLLRPSLRPVLNATGVVLHTNLGRAPLAERAIARVAEVARGYSNLEYRLGEGVRGSRHEHVGRLAASLCGAEAALVVNNGAAAVLLALSALAAGREVIVSRGELVEIGGSFRIPDVLRASGARLVEVGTTNRTHLRDYQRAITPDTALLLKVHRSNFAVLGFTAEVSVEELVALGAERGVATAVDLGSGSLHPTASLGLPAEPTAGEVARAGADVVTFSGDKLLGGPQAGILLCKKSHHEVIRTHPLMRALRPDKLALAALEATLECYRDGTEAREVPSVALLAVSPATLRARAEALRDRIARRAPELHLALREVGGVVGGGALPLAEPPSLAVAVVHPELGADALDARLRAADPPVVSRIEDGRLLLDVRTLFDRDLDGVAAAFASPTLIGQGS